MRSCPAAARPDSTAPQGMTPRTKRIVELSVQSANEMGTGYVGTEHLLLGILREGSECRH